MFQKTEQTQNCWVVSSTSLRWCAGDWRRTSTDVTLHEDVGACPQIIPGFLSTHVGFIDFAGSGVVHLCGAYAGLGYILVMGNRTGFVKDPPGTELGPVYLAIQDDVNKKVAKGQSREEHIYHMVQALGRVVYSVS